MTPPSAKRSVYLGTFVHSKSLTEIEILLDTAIFVDEHGRIVAIERGLKDDDAVQTYILKLEWLLDDVIIRACEKEQFFFPGFIGNIFRYRAPGCEFQGTVAHTM
jgi:guanine deaminase